MSEPHLTLKIKGKKQGLIAGESKNKEAIDVHMFNWAASSPTDGVTKLATGRRRYENFVVHKEMDASSTALWSAFAQNEELTEFKLEAHKTGGKAHVTFMVIELKGSRVQSIRHYSQPGGVGVAPKYLEEVEFTFQQVIFEHKAQLRDGSGAGASMFSDELGIVDA